MQRGYLRRGPRRRRCRRLCVRHVRRRTSDEQQKSPRWSLLAATLEGQNGSLLASAQTNNGVEAELEAIISTTARLAAEVKVKQRAEHTAKLLAVSKEERLVAGQMPRHGAPWQGRAIAAVGTLVMFTRSSLARSAVFVRCGAQ